MTSSQIKTNLSSYKQTFVSIARIFWGVFLLFLANKSHSPTPKNSSGY